MFNGLRRATMKTVDLNKVLEMLVNEEHTEAAGLLHEWFVERSKQIHEELMAEDNTLSQDIEDDQEAIQSEEFYSEAEGDDADAEAGEEDLEADADAEVAGEEPVADVDADMVGGEELPAEETVADTIEDLEAVMARLKAEFAEITGAEVAGDEVEGPEMDGEMEVDAAEPVDFGGDEEVVADESLTFESEEVEEEAEEVTESEDDFADLEESWTLEPVKDPNLNGGKEIGADGAKVALNDKSPLPEHDADARVGGAAVEIHAEEHHGYDREPAPEVKSKPLLKNQVKKSTDGRTKVSKEGDKSAMLNSKAGFGSDSPKSPIGQATDLRGSDFKRK
jgi:hypothetical protein